MINLKNNLNNDSNNVEYNFTSDSDDFDKELDKELEEIKNKMNNITLDEDFKIKLKNRLDEEWNAQNNTRTKKLYIPQKLVAACACFILLTSTVFADQIGGFIDNLFANTYREFEDGVSMEEMKKIEMDYVEHDGVSIKVDYAMKTEDSLYLVFNVLAEEEFDEIYIDIVKDLKIANQYNDTLYNLEKVDISSSYKLLNNRNKIIFIRVSNISKLNIYFNEILINIKKIIVKRDKNLKEINYDWKFNINI